MIKDTKLILSRVFGCFGFWHFLELCRNIVIYFSIPTILLSCLGEFYDFTPYWPFKFSYWIIVTLTMAYAGFYGCRLVILNQNNSSIFSKDFVWFMFAFYLIWIISFVFMLLLFFIGAFGMYFVFREEWTTNQELSYEYVGIMFSCIPILCKKLFYILPYGVANGGRYFRSIVPWWRILKGVNLAAILSLLLIMFLAGAVFGNGYSRGLIENNFFDGLTGLIYVLLTGGPIWFLFFGVYSTIVQIQIERDVLKKDT
ncbi:hypothetical protein [Mesorhizobium sp. SP-1A]|uniref:hypothetical protein n=1 Tax=Mesorhizobium sp. SP-1A TaxID=3077840 RepID=UPI0028F6DA47|nr:hypothetical protein [Mesorhizobium sp. SP-1A]